MKRLISIFLVSICMFAVLSGCGKRLCNVKFELADTHGVIEGELEQNVKVGNYTTKVTAIADVGYKFKEWSNGETTEEISVLATDDIVITASFEREYLSLPVLSINTEDSMPIVDKENYIRFTCSVENTKDVFKLENIAGKIKGRGNSTWVMYDKKPYKIKFDEKIDLFGNGKAKEWTLIANHGDRSLIRNYLAYNMASVFSAEMPFTTTTQNIELYLNDEYLGVYLVCEQNETGKNRVDIDDEYSDDANISYFIELDARASDEGEEGVLYFRLDSGKYAVKTPDEEDDNNRPLHMSFIKDYFIQCEQALASKDYNLVKDKIDVDSFAASYIIHELFNPQDVGFTSFYFYKPKGDKLYAGPIWDFDISSGNIDYQEESKTPYKLWAKEVNYWYNQLLQYKEFNNLVAEKLKEHYVDLQRIKINYIAIVKGQKDSFDRNFEHWSVMGEGLWPTPPELVEIETWEGQVDFLDRWLDDSLAYMMEQYCS